MTVHIKNNETYDFITIQNAKMIICIDECDYCAFVISNFSLDSIEFVGERNDEIDIIFENTFFNSLSLSNTKYNIDTLDFTTVKIVYYNHHLYTKLKYFILNDGVEMCYYFYENNGIDIKKIRNILNIINNHFDEDIKNEANKMLMMNDNELYKHIAKMLDRLMYESEYHKIMKYDNCWKTVSDKENIITIIIDTMIE